MPKSANGERHRTVRDRVIGSASPGLHPDRVTTATKPSPSLGDAIADAQLASTAAPTRAAAQIAFMNAGGVRADLLYASSQQEGGRGDLRRGVHGAAVHNILTTVTMTGAQIEAVLEQQYGRTDGTTNSRFLQPSTGFTYTWTNTAAVGLPGRPRRSS